jgi:hypothetical protein
MGKGTHDKIVSVRAFAQQIGVSEGAVRKAIKAWNFTIGVQEDGKINSAAAIDDPWVKKQLVIKPKAGVSRVMAIEKIEEKIKNTSGATGADSEDNFTDINLESEDIASLIQVRTDLKAAEAMRRREIISLAIDKKKLQELEGILVRKDAVDKSLFLFGSQLKKSLLDIPPRCVRDIMAAETEVEGIKILIDELVLVLNTYGTMKSGTE